MHVLLEMFILLAPLFELRIGDNLNLLFDFDFSFDVIFQ